MRDAPECSAKKFKQIKAFWFFGCFTNACSALFPSHRKETAMTNVIAHPTTRKVLRGRPYSLTEFARKYRLDEDEATRLYDKFGPSATELDLLMAAKRRPPVSLEALDA
jgi:hypothetical protein